MKHISLILGGIAFPALVLAQSYSSSPPPPALADPTNSRVSIEKTTLKADGIDNTLVTVTIKDMNLNALQGKKVTLTSSRGAADRIRTEGDTTDLLGKVRFRVDSLKNGTAIFSAKTSYGLVIAETVSVTFTGGLAIALNVGDLIKIPDDGDVKTLSDTAVYYYASDGRRYVFPNEKVYFSWYMDFSNVKVVFIDQMSLIPIGGNVTYKPGSRLVKFQTDPKTYIITKGGVLRWAKTEGVARGWFGVNWNQRVDDVSEAFYANYKFGVPVENALDLALDVIQSTAPTIDADKGLVSIFQ